MIWKSHAEKMNGIYLFQYLEHYSTYLIDSRRHCQYSIYRLLFISCLLLQVNLCQKLLILQNMGRTCCVHKLFWMSKSISVHNMFSPCSELGNFTYWTCNSMNNMSSYCGIVDAKIRASDKDLPVLSYDHMNVWLKKIKWSIPKIARIILVTSGCILLI